MNPPSLFERKPYGRRTLFGETVSLLKESMIASSKTKTSSTFLYDELVQPYATDPSSCMYQDNPSHCSCQIKICMSQYDSMQLVDDRISLFHLSPSEFDPPPMKGKLTAFTITYSQLASLKKSGGQGRKVSYAINFHGGKPICHRIAKTQLVNVCAFLHSHSVDHTSILATRKSHE